MHNIGLPVDQVNMPKMKTNADLDGVGGGRQRRSRVVAARRLRPGGGCHDNSCTVQICHQAGQAAHRRGKRLNWLGGGGAVNRPARVIAT